VDASKRSVLPRSNNGIGATAPSNRRRNRRGRQIRGSKTRLRKNRTPGKRVPKHASTRPIPKTRPRQLSSRVLALSLAAAYLVVAIAIGTTLLIRVGPAQPTQPTPDTRVGPALPGIGLDLRPWEAAPEDGSTTQDRTFGQNPAGFQWVSGPLGVTTVIPDGWRPHQGDTPGSTEAADPSNKDILVRYGGSPAPTEDIYHAHLRYEGVFTTNRAGYRRHRLETTTYRGLPAVEWEFEWNHTGTQRHVRSLYWRSGDVEYFVYASSPVSMWPRTRAIYDAMVAHANSG
jgi:hypothetical protein